MMSILLTLLAACGGSGSNDCRRPADWRDALEVVDGAADVVVAESCDQELVVTEARILGAAFSAELPDVGSTVPPGTWVVPVGFQADTPGTYSGTLYVSADGLDDEPGKELTAVVEGDTGSDTGT